MGRDEQPANKALYRVHRSRNFDEVVGQDHVVATLKQAIEKDQLAHAYLFTGPRGVGKTSVARILAHTINGLPYTGEELQLDVVEIDAASNRGIDEIRELREKVHIAPSSAKYKVYIIDEVHMLTSPAFNALLKTLEEPPAHVIFVLATTEPHKIPETIVSRTQRFAFKAINTDVIVKHLTDIAKKENIKLEPAAASLIADHAGGALRDAIGFLDQLRSNDTVTVADVETLLGLAPAEKIDGLKRQTFAGNTEELFSTLDRLLADGATPAQIAMQLIDALQQDVRAGNRTAVALVNDLLSVGNSREPRLRLEVVLVQTCLSTDEATRAVPDKTTARQRKQKQQPTKDEDREEDTVVIEQTAPAEASELPQKHWRDILQAIKSQNNSLYAVLRLAKAEQAEGKLILSFAFPFHAARAQEARNKQLLLSAATPVLGQELTLITRHDKSLAKTTQKEPDAVSSVIGLMGGGAIVEYDDER